MNPTRAGFDRLDREGRRLSVHGDGDNIYFQVNDPHTHRGLNAVYDLDDDAAIGLAHDLLERVLSCADCDEIVAAVTALRELERRDPPESDECCTDADWRELY